MKVLVVAAVAAVFVLVAFGQEPDKEAPQAREKSREGAEYFPLEAGMAWTYRSGKAEALVNVSRTEKFKERECFVVETLSGEKITQREWLHAAQDGIYVLKDWRPGQEVEYEPALPVVKFPFKKDQKWQWAAQVSGRTVSCSFQVKGEKTVTVPAGTFTGLELEVLKNPGGVVLKVSEVYATGVGLVCQEREVVCGKEKVKVELVKYTSPEGKEGK